MKNLIAETRAATPEDAAALAELIDLAGEGLPLYLWERMAEPGETAWDVGRRRARRESGAFSYRNAVVAERHGQTAGCLVTYGIGSERQVIDPHDTPAMFVPLLELENLALASWYVNVLAVYPSFRSQGVGTQLLKVASDQARAHGSLGESIIVSDANSGAYRLYERCGFRRKAERAMVKEGWKNPGRNWVLLVK
ncbi:MAG: GNAT family N-acetyltransferase [Kiloniellaceae bacterium]